MHRERVLDQAEEVVHFHDLDVINMLVNELADAQIRKEKCKCSSCVKHVEAIEKMINSYSHLMVEPDGNF